jgi:hypothetical protein
MANLSVVGFFLGGSRECAAGQRVQLEDRSTNGFNIVAKDVLHLTDMFKNMGG